MSDQINIDSLREKEFRDEYMSSLVRAGICYQIQALREQFGLTQAEFAAKIGKRQSVLSRLENIEHNRATVQTLLDIACALDIALIVRFASYPEFLTATSDVSPEGLRTEPFDVSSKSRASRPSPGQLAEPRSQTTAAEPLDSALFIFAAPANSNLTGLHTWLTNGPMEPEARLPGRDQSSTGNIMLTVAN